MDLRKDKLQRVVRFAGEVVAETLWPTRCALCDAPGKVLCDSCARSLPFLDWWRACDRCGAAFGRIQCDACNPLSLACIGRSAFPFSGCASATMFDDSTGSLVRVYKDLGERRLASYLAEFMVRVVNPRWEIDEVTFVPATKAALRYRGFDHAELLAREVACGLQVLVHPTLERPQVRDQRKLGGRDRIRNLEGAFSTRVEVADKSFLLVDDVFTTGATLCAASDALLAAGAARVHCLTFTRV